jgi:hypothetical protein
MYTKNFMSDFFNIYIIVLLLFSIIGVYARVCQNATSVGMARYSHGPYENSDIRMYALQTWE